MTLAAVRARLPIYRKPLILALTKAGGVPRALATIWSI
jgi:hypothetical protein